jgi:aconitase A
MLITPAMKHIKQCPLKTKSPFGKIQNHTTEDHIEKEQPKPNRKLAPIPTQNHNYTKTHQSEQITSETTQKCNPFQGQKNKNPTKITTKDETLPALRPEAPAFFNPFFLTIKLAPIKKLEDNANTNPFMLSVDIPLSASAITLQSLHHHNHNNNNNSVSPQNAIFPFHIIHQVFFFILSVSESDCLAQMSGRQRECWDLCV